MSSLNSKFAGKVELSKKKGRSSSFEITATRAMDSFSALIFSKFKEGGFPTDDYIFRQVQDILSGGKGEIPVTEEDKAKGGCIIC
jgi:hypothetical protein